ncbi:hydroxymethylbilane synthase [Trichothermofontia sichuanensis B231]|uniref:hydroxymethylbilane synthase n=1 Tax=Trichothermofontia sichuanensis TaxID=3045816 RepID=UPI002246EF4B|nr:hydroxymethylbilane synthase [Trichothermofontia sichuanensis]UZQ54659.1 hydroxymethylbilane synthase [Trichothermofontia sichuanensis B231]
MSTVASPARTVRIGSRKSQLALIQTYWVKDQLQTHFPERQFEVQEVSTKGDKILDVALSKIGDKGLFTKELEQGILDGETDFAVHSLKDVQTKLAEGLILGCITEREDPSDALVVHEKYQNYRLETLPDGAVVGTSSLRRLAQLRHHFPKLAFKDIRGNLNTRLAKLDAGEYDALILATSGMKRMGWHDRIHQTLPPEISLHAVGQGALGIECRANDSDILSLLKVIEHLPTTQACLAERAFLRELEGGCQVPIGVYTSINDGILTLTGLVASIDGQQWVKDSVTGAATEPEAIGIELGQRLRRQGAQAILDAIIAASRTTH